MKKFAFTLALCFTVAMSFVLVGCGEPKTYLEGTFVMTSFEKDVGISSLDFDNATMNEYTIELDEEGNTTFIYVKPVSNTSGETTTIDAQKDTIEGSYYFQGSKMTVLKDNAAQASIQVSINDAEDEITVKYVSTGTTYYTAKYTKQSAAE
ncbi:MAG: hypothetical protein LBN07_04590 [Christensenellaceae bacterium]|jgi:hypothetical protein|nr:hypothetical protein [Christensenellaceae bacterium]